MTVTQDRPSQIAFKAADYMAEHGYCKGMLQDKAGRVCLEGAIRMAAYGQIAPHMGSWCIFMGSAAGLWEHLAFLIRKDHPDDGPVTFNDEIAEGGEDVILLLKRAGHDLEEQGR